MKLIDRERLTKSLWFGEFYEVHLGVIYPGVCFEMLPWQGEVSQLKFYQYNTFTNILGETPK